MIELGLVVAVLIALSQLLKQYIPVKFVPLVNLALGLAFALFGGVDGTVLEQIISGAMIGLSASGLYDQTKIFKK